MKNVLPILFLESLHLLRGITISLVLMYFLFLVIFWYRFLIISVLLIIICLWELQLLNIINLRYFTILFVICNWPLNLPIESSFFSCNNISRYTCPKCNAPYCSKDCYNSQSHVICSEDFYKGLIQNEVRFYFHVLLLLIIVCNTEWMWVLLV